MTAVGVIGAGYIGARHVEAWRRLGVEPRVCGRRDRIALTTAAAGRHVICEKPLARTRTAATEMIDAYRAAGVGLYPAHVVRFHPAYTQAKDMGADPVALRLHRASAVPDWAEWLHLPERSGTRAVPRATCPAPWVAPPARFHTTFEVATRTATMRHDSGDTDAPSSIDPMTAQLAEFLAAVQDATTPRVSAEDGRAAIAARQSTEIGVPVARSAAGPAADDCRAGATDG